MLLLFCLSVFRSLDEVSCWHPLSTSSPLILILCFEHGRSILRSHGVSFGASVSPQCACAEWARIHFILFSLRALVSTDKYLIPLLFANVMHAYRYDFMLVWSQNVYNDTMLQSATAAHIIDASREHKVTRF